MTTRIRVRDVDIRTDMTLTVKQLRSLLRTVASIAAAFEEPETETPPIGFTAQVERLPETLVEEDLSDYFED